MPTLNPTASRTVAVFEIFAREKRELSNSEMAKLLGVANSSCLDLLHTLHEAGHLIRTAKTRRYYPSGRMHAATVEIAKNDPIATQAREAVELLTEKSTESSFFAVVDGNAVKIVATQPTNRSLRYTLDVGERLELHATALGKALLGALPRDEARALASVRGLTRVTGQTIADPDALFADIDVGIARGWHESVGEGAENVIGLAVSGRIQGSLVTAISLAGPSERIKANKDAYVAVLREVGKILFDKGGPSD